MDIAYEPAPMLSMPAVNYTGADVAGTGQAVYS